ncbi:MAG TPA: FAD-dependent oxidoreductase [Nocardioidaceae bacterium]|nr:FAD-dependent oxidoreductase [Nocardioidaceae bacterium]
MTSRGHTVVLGGGFAGLETAFTLRQLAGDRASLSLVSDRDTFLFKPNTIYLPFGGDESKLHIPLRKPLGRRSISYVSGTVAGIDTDRETVDVSDGTRLRYDHLVIATGATMRPGEIPGLEENAETIWTPEQMRSLGERLQWLKRQGSQNMRQRVLFLVPPNNKCAGPLYEIVFMLERWLRREGIRSQVELTWTTYESSYIQAFGPRLDDVVRGEFARRDIDGYTSAVVQEVKPDTVVYADGTSRGYDLLVAFPPYAAAVAYPGLPSDDRGFLVTDPATRRIVGHENVYAPGDAGDFPVKQAFLAFLQADAVAGQIASSLGAAPRRIREFEPTSMCVMEMFDTATFAQVPLDLTGDPAAPVAVAADAGDAYRVGVSPIWRLGKKTLGLYLPMQFRAGRPFHGGRAWRAMELGLNGMSRVLATGPGESS